MQVNSSKQSLCPKSGDILYYYYLFFFPSDRNFILINTILTILINIHTYSTN